MCDFGISGYLEKSIAKTIDAGCKPYMAVRALNLFLGCTKLRVASYAFRYETDEISVVGTGLLLPGVQGGKLPPSPRLWGRGQLLNINARSSEGFGFADV